MRVFLIFQLFIATLVSVPAWTANSSKAVAKAQAVQPSALDEYFDLLKQYPNTLGPIGHADLGEIEIVLDRVKIKEIEQTTKRIVGVVAKDKYWIWLNDAVKFPNGKFGVYSRILWLQSLKGVAGVAVMPVLSDGKIVLNRNYRHATRSWEYELPRGGLNPGETPLQAASREAKEETGMTVDLLRLLGELPPDTGLTNTVVPIYMAKVIHQGEAEREESEAIAGIEAFTTQELKKGFIDGYLSVTVDGKLIHVNLRDPFLAFALFQAEIRDLLQN